MVMVGGWGEVVMQRLACVAEVPLAGCLEPRLLMLSAIPLGFQRATYCSVEIFRHFSRVSQLNSSLLNMHLTGQMLAGVQIRSSTVTLMGKGDVEESSQQGRGGGIKP